MFQGQKFDFCHGTSRDAISVMPQITKTEVLVIEFVFCFDGTQVNVTSSIMYVSEIFYSKFIKSYSPLCFRTKNLTFVTAHRVMPFL